MSSVSSQPQFRYTQPPSKVLHLRNLPWECIEEELIELGKPFGRVVNTKCNVGANRNQAFIEFVSQPCCFIHCNWLILCWFLWFDVYALHVFGFIGRAESSYCYDILLCIITWTSSGTRENCVPSIFQQARDSEQQNYSRCSWKCTFGNNRGEWCTSCQYWCPALGKQWLTDASWN